MERTPEQQRAYEQWKANNPRRKGSASHYADGKPRVSGHTKEQTKSEALKRFKNRHTDPGNKAVSHYKTPVAHPSKKPAPHWAMDVHKARLRNQTFSSKHYTDKGHREDYR